MESILLIWHLSRGFCQSLKLISTDIPYTASQKYKLSNILSFSFAASNVCGALRDLGLGAQFKKREKHPWRSVTFSKSNTPPWVFFTFFKLYEWYQIAQSTAYTAHRRLKEITNLMVRDLTIAEEA